MKDVLRSDIEAARLAFHALFDSLSASDLKRQSLNRGWTNEELLYHMAFEFVAVAITLPLVRFVWRFPKPWSHPMARALNAGAALFDAGNALVVRLGARVIPLRSLRQAVDWAQARLIKQVRSFGATEWEGSGIYAPTRWDAVSFKEYMTLEDIVRIPLRHFAFHVRQMNR